MPRKKQTIMNQSAKLYLAHRGYWQPNLKENSIKSFQRAFDNLSDKLHGFECDFIQEDELDINHWVINHDKEKKYHKNLARLPEFILFLKKNQKRSGIINIEIKSGSKKGIEYLISSIENECQESQIEIFYSSFNETIVRMIQERFSVPVSYLITHSDQIKKIKTERLFCISISSINLLKKNNKNVLALINKKNCKCGVYYKTMNDYENHGKEIEHNKYINLIFSEPK